MRMFKMGAVLALAIACAAPAIAQTFDGVGDHQIDALGYYYQITGGKFPTGNTPNGNNGSGGTFRYLTDDPAWGYSTDVWHKDDWFPENASFALTLKNGASTIYDNNGIEDGTYGNYYDAEAQGVASADAPGLYRGYSMSNNFDWVYAGYFLLEQETTITEMIGYFDETAGFDRNSPLVDYRMNIWSNVDGDLLPTNTGSFVGDVFSSDLVPGAFATSDTGVDRVFGADYSFQHDDIFRLSYTLNEPLVLPAGIYWFSHDATVPEPASIGLMLLGTLGILSGRRVRR